MSRSGTSIDATLGGLQRTAAALAINTLTDIRAQRWLARRLPAACGYLERRTLRPAPFGDPADPFGDGYRPDHTIYLDHPVYKQALVRSELSDRKAAAAHRRGEIVEFFFSRQVPPTLDVIVAWLNDLPEYDPLVLDKLSRLTWARAEVRAGRWHQLQMNGGAAR
ncbi:hypothetical protein [Methylobacterium pseudosasicola]|uniref:Uncharacterized protein n=1 Tax=Methylobacterium pseudosasicola TaxID=582667 RepID=A0A1I4U7T3_9HYPH|nr:hypothetical protein [Methylobacterium pseudosasicola]SFM84763.1 hypothetical protein SAMN05192568_10649 [Methylobacterium pseudosasicola]